MSDKIDGMDGLADLLDRVKGKLPEIIASGGLLAAEHMTTEIRKSVMDLSADPKGGLARSFKPQVEASEGGEEVRVKSTSDLVYARIQDEGGTITAKRKFLAVPWRGANIPIGKWPRHFAKGELTFIKRKNRPPLLVRVGKKKFDLMFTLRRSVNIPAKNYLDHAWANAKDGVGEILEGKLAVGVDEA
jgi:hypothetical protein